MVRVLITIRFRFRFRVVVGVIAMFMFRAGDMCDIANIHGVRYSYN